MRQSLTQPHDARKGVDDGEATIDRLGDQQAAIVGAEIDGAIGVTAGKPPLRRFFRDRPVRERRSRRAGDDIRHEQRPFLTCTAVNRRLTCRALNRRMIGRASWARIGYAALTVGRLLSISPASGIAPSSNGKTTDSDSVYR